MNPWRTEAGPSGRGGRGFFHGRGDANTRGSFRGQHSDRGGRFGQDDVGSGMSRDSSQVRQELTHVKSEEDSFGRGRGRGRGFVSRGGYQGGGRGGFQDTAVKPEPHPRESRWGSDNIHRPGSRNSNEWSNNSVRGGQRNSFERMNQSADNSRFHQTDDNKFFNNKTNFEDVGHGGKDVGSGGRFDHNRGSEPNQADWRAEGDAAGYGGNNYRDDLHQGGRGMDRGGGKGHQGRGMHRGGNSSGMEHGVMTNRGGMGKQDYGHSSGATGSGSSASGFRDLDEEFASRMEMKMIGGDQEEDQGYGEDEYNQGYGDESYNKQHGDGWNNQGSYGSNQDNYDGGNQVYNDQTGYDEGHANQYDSGSSRGQYGSGSRGSWNTFNSNQSRFENKSINNRFNENRGGSSSNRYNEEEGYQGQDYNSRGPSDANSMFEQSNNKPFTDVGPGAGDSYHNQAQASAGSGYQHSNQFNQPTHSGFNRPGAGTSGQPSFNNPPPPPPPNNRFPPSDRPTAYPPSERPPGGYPPKDDGGPKIPDWDSQPPPPQSVGMGYSVQYHGETYAQQGPDTAYREAEEVRVIAQPPPSSFQQQGYIFYTLTKNLIPPPKNLM